MLVILLLITVLHILPCSAVKCHECHGYDCLRGFDYGCEGDYCADICEHNPERKGCMRTCVYQTAGERRSLHGVECQGKRTGEGSSSTCMCDTDYCLSGKFRYADFDDKTLRKCLFGNVGNREYCHGTKCLFALDTMQGESIGCEIKPRDNNPDGCVSKFPFPDLGSTSCSCTGDFCNLKYLEETYIKYFDGTYFYLSETIAIYLKYRYDIYFDLSDLVRCVDSNDGYCFGHYCTSFQRHGFDPVDKVEQGCLSATHGTELKTECVTELKADYFETKCLCHSDRCNTDLDTAMVSIDGSDRRAIPTLNHTEIVRGEPLEPDYNDCFVAVMIAMAAGMLALYPLSVSLLFCAIIYGLVMRFIEKEAEFHGIHSW